jgi:hypothetical protein
VNERPANVGGAHESLVFGKVPATPPQPMTAQAR